MEKEPKEEVIYVYVPPEGRDLEELTDELVERMKNRELENKGKDTGFGVEHDENK